MTGSVHKILTKARSDVGIHACGVLESDGGTAW